ncbi:MAG: serine kinase [Candidatus Aminicenantes bacterium]|nr:MAG: serine kinase [Candidatus Aminicenantes bacterium]
MKLKEVIEKLQLKVLISQENLDLEVTGGYTSDLLSDVIANSKKGNLWITLQIHQNIIAVAKLKDLAGVIIVNNREPDEETLRKAKEENVFLLRSEEMAFEVSGKLYELIGS